MQNYKAIIFDLDGTAIPNTPNGQPSKKLIEVIQKAQHTFKLCAATGRPISNAEYILEALHLIDPCIISAGTQIINPRTKEVLWEQVMEKKDVEKILGVCSSYTYEILFREELMGSGKSATKRTVNEDINVIYIMQISKSDAGVILSKLKEIKGITASGVLSWTQNGVDIHVTSSKATKEHAVEKLLDMLGLSKSETIGVGDGDNDIHLFKSVGLKVAMGNATESIKKSADIITKSVDDDGLTSIIEEHLHS